MGVTASKAGVFQAVSDQGGVLAVGQTKGRITDLDASTLAEVTSPIPGVVHTMYPQRLVYPGDRLYTLLLIRQPTGW